MNYPLSDFVALKWRDDDNRRDCVLVFSPGHNMGQMPVNIVLVAIAYGGTAVRSVE
jgi:hypothetical protein